MKPIYVDIHIHTSDNPNNLNKNYDVDLLLEKVKAVSKEADTLLSLTDHNTINKEAYLTLSTKTENVLIGAELHVKNYKDRPPYHCHIIFDLQEINCDIIDFLNSKLDKLYPDKEITPKTEKVPTLEEIINEFSDFDFILLPHGGQSHSTFDKSIPRDIKFDSTIERSIYYNQFDGFTARDNCGLDETQEYFKRLGIYGFVNLITCTDNYNPNKYPNAKTDDSGPFIPTWMLAKPTFNGLRLSLSDSARLIYSSDKPVIKYEHINKVHLNNEKVDIDILLTPGLNVVIGGSSSGKTLLVDSIYCKLENDFEESKYKSLGVEDIIVSNPSGIIPHYISQNYIMKVIDQSNEDTGIENIDLIKKVFPEDFEVVQQVRNALAELKKDINELIDKVQVIENEINIIARIPNLSRLLVELDIEKNIIQQLQPDEILLSTFSKDDSYYDNTEESLLDFKNHMKKNPFATDVDEEIESILNKIRTMRSKVKFENSIRTIINAQKLDIDTYLLSANSEHQQRSQDFEKLIKSINIYVKAKRDFEKVIEKISGYSYKVNSREITSMGHRLYIENSFKLTKETFLNTINKYLKTQKKIQKFESINPSSLFFENYSGRNPKVNDYEDFQNKIYGEFQKLNKRSYRILTKEGRDFEELSAGWKTSILLDLILGYEDDMAPLIIDQPEDNLATNYINSGLINSIKKIKSKKQIILVSHNATIPMLGDAQNVILCNNDNGIIVVRASELEGSINDVSMVDYIAKITDGGKSSIKKRVKKYNLKKFRGEY